jgi:hypothetical protein
MIQLNKKIGIGIASVFTTFVLLSGMPVGALTSTEAVSVMTKTSAVATVTSAAPVQINPQSVSDSIYFVLGTSAYDLAFNQKARLKANTAVIKAMKEISLLDQNSTACKNLNARIVAVLTRMENAKKYANTTKIVETSAQATAEAAIKALEGAPLVTTADIVAAKTLQTTAVKAVSQVKDSVKNSVFTARVKVVADKIAKL